MSTIEQVHVRKPVYSKITTKYLNGMCKVQTMYKKKTIFNSSNFVNQNFYKN